MKRSLLVFDFEHGNGHFLVGLLRPERHAPALCGLLLLYVGGFDFDLHFQFSNLSNTTGSE